MKSLLLALLSAASLLRAEVAVASEPEAVRLEVHGPAGCVDEAALREDVAALGGAFRDANLDDRARTFRVEVERGEGDEVTGRLVVRDLAFRERAREITKTDCAELSRALALFVATALDEAPAPEPSAPIDPTPAPPLRPEPAAGSDGTRYVRRGRLGSGGIVATAFASGLTSSTAAKGIRVQAAVRAFGTTRLGLAGGVAREERKESFPSHDSHGSTSRLGALIGWGAPWNDSIAGFAAEVGVAWGEHRGRFSRLLPGGACGADRFEGLHCQGGEQSAVWRFASPYVAWQLVLQLPIGEVAGEADRGARRPRRPSGPGGDAYLASTAEMGLVWQAW